MEKYSSGLVAEALWLQEYKLLVKLRYQGDSWDKIKIKCTEENLLGISKPYRAMRTFGYLRNRIDELDYELMEIFSEGDISTQKTINILSIAKKNRLFFEFLYEVYSEKINLGLLDLTSSDVNIFFKNKQIQDEAIAGWTDVTLKRLNGAYLTLLRDSGFVTTEKGKNKITPPLMDIALENYLKNKGQKNIIKAIGGEF